MILALLAACAGRVPVGDSFVADVPAPDAYAATLGAATRELRLYDQLTTVLLARAVYLDADTRRAIEGMRAHLLLLEAPAREARLAASLAEAETIHAFVVSADAQPRTDLRLGFGEDEPWRARLFADGKPCSPLDITEIPATPMDERLYPFHTRWSTLWSVRFQADCGHSSPLVLQLTGPHGAGEMSWR